MERKAKTIPNITERAIYRARRAMRAAKDCGTYANRRIIFGKDFFRLVRLKAFGVLVEDDAVFNEILDAAKTAYISTGLNRFNPKVPKKRADLVRASNVSYDIIDVIDNLERRCMLHNRWDVYNPVHTTMATILRILNSRLLLTAYLNYPRIRQILETYRHIHIKIEEK